MTESYAYGMWPAYKRQVRMFFPRFGPARKEMETMAVVGATGVVKTQSFGRGEK